MATAIVEFNPLPDAIRAAAENHDFWPRLRVGFVLVFVSRVKIRGEGLKFGGTGVHALEDGRNAIARALQAHGSRRSPPNLRQLLVARAVALYLAQQIFRSRLDRHARSPAVHGGQLLNLMDEPRVDFRELADFFGVEAALHGR